MSLFRKTIVLVLIMTFVYIGVGCEPQSYGNRESYVEQLSNFYNGNDISYNGENIYYLDIFSRTLTRHYEGQNVVIAEDVGKIYHSNQGIFFCTFAEPNILQFMNVSGGEKKKIYEVICRELIDYSENTSLFISYDNHLYLIDSKFEVTMLFDLNSMNIPERARNIQYNEKYVYFIAGGTDEQQIYSLDLSSGEVTNLGGDYVRKFFLINERIFYLNGVDEKIYMMDIHGDQNELITNNACIYADTFGAWNNKLIYYDFQVGNTFYLDVDTMRITVYDATLHNPLFLVNGIPQ